MSRRSSKSTFKSVFAALSAIAIFAVVAILVYVYAIDPMLSDDSSTTQDPGTDSTESEFTVSLRDATFNKDSTVSIYSEYTLFTVSSEEDYTVEVIPISDVKFDYYVDGKAERYSDIKNLFEVLGVLYTDNGFSINPPEGNIVDILAKYHGVNRASIVIDGDISKIKAFFAIKITTSESSITLTCIFGSAITDIDLSKDNIVL